jgi:hypothetical protein
MCTLLEGEKAAHTVTTSGREVQGKRHDGATAREVARRRRK